ncbi:MAG: acetylornithine deacetylase [Planctomycetota bacterium]|jgi:acetylornithine deacetylase
MLPDQQLLARLVGIDSTSAKSNRPIADVICDYLDRPGVTIVQHPGDDAEKVNLVVRMGPEAEDGGGLTLSGHLDVVPATEPQWKSDPFTLVERDGALYGRGASDMKGFVALAVNTAAAIDARSLRRPLCLLLTCDEELGTLGAQRLADDWSSLPPMPTSTIVGEPTSLRVVRMHKGHLKILLGFRGRGAHTGSPQLGINAIEPAGPVLVALSALRRELAAERTPESRCFPDVPYPVLAVTSIDGGSAINVVPDRCTIEVGIRLMPGQSAVDMIERVESVLTGSGAEPPPMIEEVGDSPPLLCPAEAPINRRLCGMIGQTEDFGVSFASDAGPFQQVGQECVLFGPGTIEVAHRPNEHLPIDEFVRCRSLLDRVVAEHCLEPADTPRS